MKTNMQNVLTPKLEVLKFPGFPPAAPRSTSRLGRFLQYTGVAMPNTELPRGWSWNPSVITLLILIASLLLGGGYYLGVLDAERTHMQQRLQKAEDDAFKAKQLESYNSGQLDALRNHGNTNIAKKTGGH